MALSRDRSIRSASASPSTGGRVASLTGIRTVAALLVVATHAAYSTGKYPQGYLGLASSRLEVGVPIFFALSGFLLFRPWVQAAVTGGPAPSVRRYAWHRVRRIMPAYVVTVLVAFLVYHWRDSGPNPGHSWTGFFRNLTLTQIYTDNYVYMFLHQGLIQMWSLAVEVSFYVVLPGLAYLLLVVLCRREWRPVRLLTALAVLAVLSPAWLVLVHSDVPLPEGARLWLPTYLLWFLAGMALTVLQAMRVGCYGFVAVPLAVICFLIISTPLGGEFQTSPTGVWPAVMKTLFFGAIAALAIAPPALGSQHGWYNRFLASRPMVWLGEISYEIFLVHMIVMDFVMVDLLHIPVFTGSMLNLFVVTVLCTIPVAWVLHRFTRPRYA